MKKLIILMVLILSFIPLFSQPDRKVTEIKEVFRKTCTIDTAGSSGVSGIANDSAGPYKSDIFSIDCDTLSFILEVSYSDSAKYSTSGIKDSMCVLAKFQPTSPNGMTDSTAWATWTTVLTKAAKQQIVLGGPVTRVTSWLQGRLNVLIYQGAATTGVNKQKIEIVIYRVKKWYHS